MSFRVAIETVEACLAVADGSFSWHVIPAHHLYRACERIARGDVDLVIAKAKLPWCEGDVLADITRRHATELLVLDERCWPDDLAAWLGRARARRARR